VTTADRALLVAVLAKVTNIEALLARRRGHDPVADERFVAALARSCGRRPFTAGLLLRRADVDPALRASLQAAGLMTSRQIGQALRRCRDRDVGFVLERIARDERGAVWQITPAVSGA
jgi:hypothetical protein